MRLNEKEWWNEYGDLVERIWIYDDYLTEVVRRDYLTEMQDFLFKPGGRLLDFGCGTGWLSLPLARRGMAVDGIDSSEAQIRKAREQAQIQGLTNTRFWCADRISDEQRGVYNAILLHALVHHIPVEQRQAFLRSVADALLVEGRLYLYEPLMATANPPWQAWVADKLMGGVFRGLRWVALSAHLYEPEIEAAVRAGWTMRSPEEQPSRLDELLHLLPPQLSVVRISPWHCWSIEYANFCMSLRPGWRRRFERAAPVFYQVDRHVRVTRWYPYLRSWPMVSILAEKHE
jgi:2-polyprenyl-3-methyl-5-hydroxy-6-metoxy-1,4-benzoquinol methylase